MYKVLIVDDEMIVRHAVKTLVKWEESRFEYAGSAANGMSALDMVSKSGVDIIITDIKMPEMDGLELIKQLMANGFNGEILVLSNYNDFDLVREALKCGAHDYMLKLTLKTESFMQALEEMAVKLDSKRSNVSSHNHTAPEGVSSSITETKNRTPAILREMDAATSGSSAWKAEGFLEGGLRVYSFVILLNNDEQGLRQVGEFQETLDKLADGLFTGSRWTYAIRSDQWRFLLVTAYSSNVSSVIPEELARRIINLASMYYNVKISVVYASEAVDEQSLASEMRRNRQAEGLLFYSQPKLGCLSNREKTSDGDEEFQSAEIKLRNSLRKPNASAMDLWVESALNLVDKAAERNVHPRVLKQAISGGIWSIANTEELGIRYAWDAKPWLEVVEAANSDSHLKESIRELADEVTDFAGHFTPVTSSREEVRRATQYLQERYSERVTIADVAVYVGLSEPYLCQVFKADTGQSILTYLNEIRMTKAYEMLSTGNYLVKQAAIEVGIPDPFYFNRLFKKRFGVAPKNVKMP